MRCPAGAEEGRKHALIQTGTPLRAPVGRTGCVYVRLAKGTPMGYSSDRLTVRGPVYVGGSADTHTHKDTHVCCNQHQRNGGGGSKRTGERVPLMCAMSTYSGKTLARTGGGTPKSVAWI